MSFTLTIGIPAHNEEKNIGRLLQNILMQDLGGEVVLEKIIVLADGCTDQTVSVVEEIAVMDYRVSVISDGQRHGKAYRLNQLYQKNESDFLVTLDADVLPADRGTLLALIRAIVHEPAAAVVAGNNQALPGITLIEKIGSIHQRFWYYIRKDFMQGDNIYNSSGCIFAFRKDFVQSLELDPKTVSDQKDIYRAVKRAGKKFLFSQEAVVKFRVPTTLQELTIHSSRMGSDGGRSGDDSHPQIPTGHKAKAILSCFAHAPMVAVIGIVAHLLQDYLPNMEYEITTQMKGTWIMLASTKSLYEDRQRKIHSNGLGRRIRKALSNLLLRLRQR